MYTGLNRVLASIALPLVLIDFLWVAVRHLAVDYSAYETLAVLILPMIGGAIFYERYRIEPSISALFAGASFLLVFSAACSLLSYLLITVAGSRIDFLLAHIDQAMGFDWVAVMTFAAYHPIFSMLLGFAYLSIMPQIVLFLFYMSWSGNEKEIYGLCIALATGGLLAVGIWAIHPAFGAFSVFDLPPDVSKRLGLALDGHYGKDLVLMLKNGPGLITPRDIRGIVGFPSYHTVQALVLIFYSRVFGKLRLPIVLLNIAVIAATPIHGGHDLVDVIAGAIVAAVVIKAATIVVDRASMGQAASDAVIPLTEAAL